MKNKKPLWIILISLDVAITVALFVISIIMLASTVGKTSADIAQAEGFIGFLQKNPTIYLVGFVVPLFVLLAANVIGLVLYVRHSTKKEPVKVNDLSEAQKEALRAELLKDLTGGASPAAPAQEAKPEAPKEEPKAEDPKAEDPKAE